MLHVDALSEEKGGGVEVIWPRGPHLKEKRKQREKNRRKEKEGGKLVDLKNQTRKALFTYQNKKEKMHFLK